MFFLHDHEPSRSEGNAYRAKRVAWVRSSGTECARWLADLVGVVEVLCHHKRDKALCHRDEVRDTPSLDRCVPGCGNIARTDQQAAQLRDRAALLERQAAHVPEPIGDRMRANAAKLRAQADKHNRTRVTIVGEPA